MPLGFSFFKYWYRFSYFFCRAANKKGLEVLLNNEFVDRIEIVLKERIGVKGKTISQIKNVHCHLYCSNSNRN